MTEKNENDEKIVLHKTITVIQKYKYIYFWVRVKNYLKIFHTFDFKRAHILTPLPHTNWVKWDKYNKE